MNQAKESNQRIAGVVRRHGARLRAFLRRRIADAAEAEDLLQDAWETLIEADRGLEPIDNVGAWLMRVLRNRLIDRTRKSRPVLATDLDAAATHGAPPDGSEVASADWLENLPSAMAGPEASHARELWITAVEAALAALPEPQRRVFIAHEFEGQDFASLAAQWNEPINTLLSRKHAAVKNLRERLRAAREELDMEGEL